MKGKEGGLGWWPRGRLTELLVTIHHWSRDFINTFVYANVVADETGTAGIVATGREVSGTAVLVDDGGFGGGGVGGVGSGHCCSL